MGYAHICHFHHISFECNILKAIQIDNFIEVYRSTNRKNHL